MHKLLGTNQSKRSNKIPNEVHAAFARFDTAKVELESFRQKHPKIIEQYNALRAEVESAFNECKSLYAQNKEVLGPEYQGFSITKKRQVDTELLLALLPDAINLVSFTMPMKEFDALVATGKIPEEVAEQVVSYNESVSGPKV